ncbi:MAG: hypothetical protein DRN81_06770, partial [Thermoproteota archaeon]
MHESIERKVVKPSSPISLVILLLPTLLLAATTTYLAVTGRPGPAVLAGFLLLAVLALAASSVVVNAEWEEAIILRLGKYNRSI